MVTSRKRELLNALLAMLEEERQRHLLRSVVAVSSGGGDPGDRGKTAEEFGSLNRWAAQGNVVQRQINELASTLLGPTTIVRPGALVTCRYPKEGKVRIIFMLSTAGGAILQSLQGSCIVMTPSTPLGRAILGHGAGEVVEARTPAGPQEIEILSVE